ncbi:MAG TPA: polyribonucleotide nucleotidyltransferase [Spirochaetota bacterium]|nr:polyribonucleotide nucleotidyltransferase [Spirochaetota bacterium]HOM38146.1 polyribonucleotide nucleotidyltransferase [Spirochaetota bacterium]HPQ48636.1 polyribonucleotide nucleotidyltransferase [Spirochaetota bacterium]
MQEKSVSLTINNKKLLISTGKVARQANGSVIVQYGDTVIFSSAVMAKEVKEDPGFFPLSVNYIEKFYAAGKIPGGFIKREGKPSDKEVLISRIIDRSIRPLFPSGFRNEVQVVPMTIAVDQENPTDVLGVIAASAALSISDIPFNGPVASVRVGLIDGKYIINPTFKEMEQSRLNVVVSGTKNGITMIEGGGNFVSEEEMENGIKAGYETILKIVDIIEELVKIKGKPKKEVQVFLRPTSIDEEVKKEFLDKLKSVLEIKNKQERVEKTEALYKSVGEFFKTKYDEKAEYYAKEALLDLEYDLVREKLFKEGIRVDGRKPDEIRDIHIEVGLFKRLHGSALFTRGETQSLGILTLGSVSDEQKVDDIEGETSKKYMLHYNFPPFSVGEVGKIGAPGRREIGHGYLAERSIEPTLPSKDEFPYTIRLVSEIMESNGSSSMASVCSCCLALMDGGVPIKEPVAGIAMGLMYNKDKTDYKILTDIQGIEDHYGDMDFKVAGSRNGITGFQLDIKVDALPVTLLREALEKAKVARNYILDKMAEVIAKPRDEISEYAPKILIIKANPDNIRLLIGPGGKTIKKIIEEYGIKIDVENDIIKIVAPNLETAQKAYDKVYDIVRDIKIGDVIQGEVKKITDFGFFIETSSGREGLCHISNISNVRVKNVRDYVTEGQVVKAKVINIDDMGRINISLKDI